MDKNAIKKYAVWARRELIEKVSQKALQFGIEDSKELNAETDSVNGLLLSETEKKQRKALIQKINDEGFSQVIEEVAYTWFNRFIALRFMEVNGYLPSHIRVFTDECDAFRPQILTEALHLEFADIDQEKVLEMKQDNKDEELFKYLLVLQCNELSVFLPNLFSKIADYTELLLPDYLLREGSVIEQLVSSIPLDDWSDEVQIVGWLYQYYNTEPKEVVFANLKNNIKISKENIPAATQLFTPDWIVRYMVENSLGRLWIDGHDNSKLVELLKYYKQEPTQEECVNNALLEMRNEYHSLKPEDIKCIDPCMGSGHILVYMFDVLVLIYKEYGYTEREAAELILKNNLYGLDIDERAAQLSAFAVMMKARQYDRRIFSKHIDLNIVSFQGLHVNDEVISNKTLCNFLRRFKNAAEYGSLLKIEGIDLSLVEKEIEIMENNIFTYDMKPVLYKMLKIARILSSDYHVVVTNPPYMANGGFDALLDKYVKDNYKDGKSDLYAAFILRCKELTKPRYFQAMITQHSWMFISSYEKLRLSMTGTDVICMAHLGARAFEEIAGEVVQTTTFVIRKSNISDYVATYSRLLDYKNQQAKENGFLDGNNEYYSSKKAFEIFPGNPYVYWIGKHVMECFNNYPILGKQFQFREGIHTADNNRFLRLWFEVPYNKIVFDAASYDDIDKRGRWVPYNKGGKYRKWYGNNDFVIGFDSVYRKEMEKLKGHVRPSQDLYFREGGTWTAVASGKLGLRYYPNGFLFDAGGQVVVGDNVISCIAMLNTKIYNFFADMLMPTLNYKCGMLKTLPDLRIDDEEINSRAVENINLARKDWNNFETSWEFITHPLLKYKKSSIEEAYAEWEQETQKDFQRMKQNEQYINEAYLNKYELQREIIISESDDSELSVRKANREREIKSFISYAVGCMFGRYSLDESGIVFAGGQFDFSRYKSFDVDEDNIIPITDDEYFADDIVSKFVTFVSVAFGSKLLEDNLQYIAETLGKSGSSRETIRQYFVSDFFADHCSSYSATGTGKRPIYWLFDSGKNGGFKCLVYMHRYQSDTIARIRTDYVHELQSRYRTELEEISVRLANASGNDRVKLAKREQIIKSKNDELHQYEEKLHHYADMMIAIDLDDGFKANYERIKDIVAKVK